MMQQTVAAPLHIFKGIFGELLFKLHTGILFCVILLDPDTMGLIPILGMIPVFYFTSHFFFFFFLLLFSVSHGDLEGYFRLDFAGCQGAACCLPDWFIVCWHGHLLCSSVPSYEPTPPTVQEWGPLVCPITSITSKLEYILNKNNQEFYKKIVQVWWCWPSRLCRQ